MNFWELSSNIDMPERSTKAGKSKYPFKDMKVGESVFFEGKTSLDKECVYAYNYGRKAGKKFSARSVAGGVRIWRIE